MKLLPRHGFDPALHTKMLVPGDALKKRVHKAHDDCRCHQLRPELGALCNAARHDGRDGGCEREQEEELDQRIPAELHQRLCANKKMRAVGHGVTDDEIDHRGYRKVHQDLDQRIHLVLFADRAQLQKRKPGVHGQHHDRPEQDEQGICALFECFHNVLAIMIDRPWCVFVMRHRFAPS